MTNEMKKLLIKVAYNGKNYCGFQSQKNGVTVQEKLTEAAAITFGCQCNVTGCSRTDSGVHAKGFCASVSPAVSESECDGDRDGDWMTVPHDKVRTVFNNHLPHDIAVVDVALVDADFHPRYDVMSKEYIYVISDSGVRDPFRDGLVMRVPNRITDDEIEAMDAAARQFCGTHDFRAFMASGSKIETTVRTVYGASVRRIAGDLVFAVSADGFLYNMVRIMTGTLLGVRQGKIAPRDITAIIDSRDRGNAGITVPPDGLYLNRVEYTKPVSWIHGD